MVNSDKQIDENICSRSLAGQFPDLVEEWDFSLNGDMLPENTMSGSGKRIHWKCKSGHSWEATVESRTRNHYSCPYCSGRKAVPGKTDLATLFPDVAAEWDYMENEGLSPEHILPKSNVRVAWVCCHGHKWVARVADRVNGTKCPYCTGRLVLPESSLAQLFPDVMLEWDFEKNKDLDPGNVAPFSARSVWWRCEFGHSWRAIVSNRTKHDAGCPFCQKKRPFVGETDLATTHPQLAEQWCAEKNGSCTPLDVMAGTNKKVWWRCEKGHEWEAVIANRTKHGSGCPFCQNRYPIIGETDLATTHPQLAEQWCAEKNGSCTPLDVMAGTNKKAWWRCEKGHEWQATVASRARLNAGCPFCNGQKVIAGETDLATQAPHLLEQWDVVRNVDLDPKEISLYSTKKVWWRCSEGHGWKASVYNRSRSRGCPCCVKMKRFIE